MATMRSSRRASSTSARPNTSVYEGALQGFFFTSPVAMSNGAMPWNFSGLRTAGPYPAPLRVTTCMSTGTSVSSTAASVSRRSPMSCPSMGAVHRMPSCSKIIERGMMNCFIDSFTLRPKFASALPTAPPLSSASCTESRVWRYCVDVRM